MIARTHFAHMFQKSFHTHTCDRTSHVCVRARTFATHTLVHNIKKIKNWWIRHKCPYLMNMWIQNISKNQNLYPHQSQFTFQSLLRDTLYFATDKHDHFKTISSQFSAIYIIIFHITKVQTVILRCWTGLYLNWFKSYDTNEKRVKTQINITQNPKNVCIFAICVTTFELIEIQIPLQPQNARLNLFCEKYKDNWQNNG